MPTKGGRKDGIHFVYPDVVIAKKMKRMELKEVTEYKRVFDRLHVINSYNDIIDKNVVDEFWTAIGSTNNSSIYSLQGLVNGEKCAT